MSTGLASSRPRIDRSPRTLALAAGDVALIALFVVAGQFSHDMNPFAQVGRFAGALFPFLVGWAVAAFVFGAYAARATASVRSAALVAAESWVVAALIGQALRATPFFPGDLAIPFVLVSLGVGLVLLVPWRVVVAATT